MVAVLEVQKTRTHRGMYWKAKPGPLEIQKCYHVELELHRYWRDEIACVTRMRISRRRRRRPRTSYKVVWRRISDGTE